MAGWLPVRRTPKEQPTAPLRGFKLAHPMVSADGTRAGFGGVTLGRANVYEVVADAECAQGGRHQSPSRWCDCGFYCVHTLDDARALACDPDYRYAVLLEITASGRFMRYERGLRYAKQRVTLVRVAQRLKPTGLLLLLTRAEHAARLQSLVRSGELGAGLRLV